MHYNLLVFMMRQHGMNQLLSDASVKKLLSETVLATDMSVHNNFMARFADPELPNKDLFTRKVLISQALIKCADISNPSRPYHVAAHWARALMGEWISQANLERVLDLPVSVLANDDNLSEAKGQLFFISVFARPLLELVANRVPGVLKIFFVNDSLLTSDAFRLEMQTYVDHCQTNLQLWTDRKAMLEGAAEDAEQQQQQQQAHRLPPRYDDYRNTFPLTLKLTHRASILSLRPESTPVTVARTSLQHANAVKGRIRKPSSASSSSTASGTSYSSAYAFSGSSSEGEESLYHTITTTSSPASPQSEADGFAFDKERAGTSTMSTTSEYHDCLEGDEVDDDEQRKYAAFRAAAAKSGLKWKMFKVDKRNSWAGTGGLAGFQRMTSITDESKLSPKPDATPKAR
jgi:hypothetical protein